jgi:hypothetical protein
VGLHTINERLECRQGRMLTVGMAGRETVFLGSNWECLRWVRHVEDVSEEVFGRFCGKVLAMVRCHAGLDESC